MVPDVSFLISLVMLPNELSTSITLELPEAVANELNMSRSISFLKFDENTTLHQIYTEYQHTTNDLAKALLELIQKGVISTSLVKEGKLSNPLLNLDERIHIVEAVEQIQQVNSSMTTADRKG
jgi:hypothetical protein